MEITAVLTALLGAGAWGDVGDGVGPGAAGKDPANTNAATFSA
jgi:hypothetical protein